MTASLGMGVDAGAALVSTRTGAAFAFPHGADSSMPTSKAGEDGFRSRWQWLLDSSATADEAMQCTPRCTGAKPDGELSGSKMLNSLLQSGVQTAATAPLSEKQGAEVVLKQRVNGVRELSQRSFSKGVIPSALREVSGKSRQRKEGRDDPLRRAGGDPGYQPDAKLPISGFAPLSALWPCDGSPGSTADWSFQRNHTTDNPMLSAVAGGHADDVRPGNQKTAQLSGEPVPDSGGGATAVQPNVTADQEIGKNDPGKLSFPNSEDLRGQGPVAESDANSQGKYPQAISAGISLVAEQQEQRAATSAAPGSDLVGQTAPSTEAARNQRPEVQLASHGMRSKHPADVAAQTLHSGATAPAVLPDTVISPHHLAAGLDVEHSFHPKPPGSEGAVMAARETFAALDGEPRAAGTTWIHAGAQRAEAGFQDPALGWVAVRADLGAGGVHASILPGSADAAQTLGGHLAGLHAHLADEQIPVQSLSMRASADGAGAGLGQGALQQDSRHSSQGEEHGPAAKDILHGIQRDLQKEHFAVRPAQGAPVVTAGQGTYISVMA